jgi:hypothetical protein
MTGYKMNVGDKFNEWTVLDSSPVATGVMGQGYFYKCRCSCGAEKNVRGTYLRLNLSKSCGCNGNQSKDNNLARFHTRYLVNAATGCWEWQRSFVRGGYGSFFYKGRIGRAHRVSYILHYGEIDPDILVCHKCDNPKCVNPEHLFLGTYQDNNHDMHRKHRAPTSNNKIQGSLNIHAKITEADVINIRALSASGISKAEIGRQYNIRDSNVCKIVSRQSWRHVY